MELSSAVASLPALAELTKPVTQLTWRRSARVAKGKAKVGEHMTALDTRLGQRCAPRATDTTPMFGLAHVRWPNRILPLRRPQPLSVPGRSKGNMPAMELTTSRGTIDSNGLWSILT